MSDSGAGGEKTRKYDNQVTSGDFAFDRKPILRRNERIRGLVPEKVLTRKLTIRADILPIKKGQTMTQGWHRRGWALVAAIAIVIALAALLVPHGNSGDAGAWLAVLPILLFVGVISPRSLLSPMAYMYLGRMPCAPILPATFQRPPPNRLG
jgi:hypothetical protein